MPYSTAGRKNNTTSLLIELLFILLLTRPCLEKRTKYEPGLVLSYL